MSSEELKLRVDIACKIAGTHEWKNIYEQEAIRGETLSDQAIKYEFRDLHGKDEPFFLGMSMIKGGEIAERIGMV